MGIEVTFQNARDVMDQVGLVQSAIDREMGRIHYRVAQMVKDTAVAYAPRSPTAAEEKRVRNMLREKPLTAGQKRGIKKRKATNKAKREAARARGEYTTGKTHTPGGLMRSVSARATYEMAEVFVAMNSEAGKYAYGIHELKGVTWRNRGVGTILKGPKADDKFITRAAADKEPEIIKIVEDQLTRATERFRNT
jgi:hypothetical protein